MGRRIVIEATRDLQLDRPLWGRFSAYSVVAERISLRAFVQANFMPYMEIVRLLAVNVRWDRELGGRLLSDSFIRQSGAILYQRTR